MWFINYKGGKTNGREIFPSGFSKGHGGCGGKVSTIPGLGTRGLRAVEKKLAFVAMDNFYDQAETLNGYVLCQGFQVKNLSASDITLDGLLDFETYDKKEKEVGVEEAIRALAGSSKTITAKTSAGAVTSIAVLDPASSKTLKPGESATVWFSAIAPTNETTLDILYQGVHQCYLGYGKDLPSHEPGGGGSGSASSTVSSSSATSESASTAASEDGVMESPSSVDREASASR